jgi:deoxyribodipyrimidine photo-lyase
MTAIWWIRRDLRLHGNLTLQTALEAGPILPVYIFDPYFWNGSPHRRYEFLANGLRALDADLRKRGSYLVLRLGAPVEVLHQLLNESGAKVIYAEEDFTPYARQRDQKIAAKLPLKRIQGQLVQHPLEIHKSDDSPYTVFTPFSKVWKSLLPDDLGISLAPERIPKFLQIPSESIPEYPQEKYFPVGEAQAQKRLETFLADKINDYGVGRNQLYLDGTSSLSPYIHFGMLGLRTVVYRAQQAILTAPDKASREFAYKWLDEIIWREFYIHILYHYPHVRESSFRPQYDRIQWRNDPVEFDAWKAGQTGYPVVDAAMRQMIATGWMHNRARMIAASFLVKDLLIDWRWGERWFMQNLLDGDLAANNGG